MGEAGASVMEDGSDPSFLVPGWVIAPNSSGVDRVAALASASDFRFGDPFFLPYCPVECET